MKHLEQDRFDAQSLSLVAAQVVLPLETHLHNPVTHKKTALGKVEGKSLVERKLSLYRSTKNMALGSLNSFKSPFLAIITKLSFPFGSVFCSCGVLFGFGITPSLCLWVTHNCVSLSCCFLFRSSFKISSGDNGSKVIRSPLYMRTTLLDRPQI